MEITYLVVALMVAPAFSMLVKMSFPLGLAEDLNIKCSYGNEHVSVR